MKNKKSMEMAKEILEFNLRMGKWNKSNIEKTLNINSKGCHDVTIRQFHILIMVDKVGLNTVSKLTEFMQISKSSLSLTLSKLEKNGFLRKEQPCDDDDGRKVYLYVTDKGLDSLKDAEQKVMNSLMKFYDELNDSKKQDLEIGLKALNRVYH